MNGQIAGQYDFVPIEPVRCNGCGSADILPLPVLSWMDRLGWAAFFGPFKCRRCHRKLYRRIRKKIFMES